MQVQEREHHIVSLYLCEHLSTDDNNAILISLPVYTAHSCCTFKLCSNCFLVFFPTIVYCLQIKIFLCMCAVGVSVCGRCECVCVYWPWLAAPAGAPWWPQGSCPAGSAAHTQSEPTSLLCPFLPGATHTPGIHTSTQIHTRPQKGAYIMYTFVYVYAHTPTHAHTNTRQREDGSVSGTGEPQLVTTTN